MGRSPARTWTKRRLGTGAWAGSSSIRGSSRTRPSPGGVATIASDWPATKPGPAHVSRPGPTLTSSVSPCSSSHGAAYSTETGAPTPVQTMRSGPTPAGHPPCGACARRRSSVEGSSRTSTRSPARASDGTTTARKRASSRSCGGSRTSETSTKASALHALPSGSGPVSMWGSPRGAHRTRTGRRASAGSPRPGYSCRSCDAGTHTTRTTQPSGSGTETSEVTCMRMGLRTARTRAISSRRVSPASTRTSVASATSSSCSPPMARMPTS